MIKKATVISGDILASTSLEAEDRLTILKKTQELLDEISIKYGAHCRIIHGDYIECVTTKSEKALEIALLLKTYIKAILISNHPRYKTNNRVKAFKTYGLRLAIGYGELLQLNPKENFIDGEAIYLTGRFLKDYSTHNKERMNIKTTLTFLSQYTSLNLNLNTILSLIDELINKATSKQCKVLYYKLLGENESEIAKLMNISQPMVNRQSSSISWNSIEQAVNYYEFLILEDKNKD